jgi:cytoplasmic iron level regulating protein YaaA (DUF328/UPF0246 family)
VPQLYLLLHRINIAKQEGHVFYAESAVYANRGKFYTKLHSNEFECKTQKFLKNRRSLIFQKLAGVGFASAIPICFLLKATWY